MKKFVLTKKKIEDMKNDICHYLVKNDLASNISIYYNNNRVRFSMDKEDAREHCTEWEPKIIYKFEKDVNPFDYFDYANPHHILSMSFEGSLYDALNDGDGTEEEALKKIMKKYGVYYELGNDWNLSCYPIDNDMEIETTEYKIKPEPIYIHSNNLDEYPDIKKIVNIWREYQSKIGDVGSCVIGAGFQMTKNGQEYFLSPCSRYQGSISWETNIKEIKNLLIEAGYQNIYFNYGNMD